MVLVLAPSDARGQECVYDLQAFTPMYVYTQLGK